MPTPRAKRRADMPDPLATPPRQPELQPAAEPDKPKGVAVYSPIEAGLALMLEKHGHVLVQPPKVTAETRPAVFANCREMVTFRTSLEKTRKAEKEESLRYGQLVDAEARRIQAVATPIEKAYQDALDAYDQAEANRKADITRRIGELRDTSRLAIGKPIAALEEMLEALEGTDLVSFDEFREAAAIAQEAARKDVNILLAQARQAEADRVERERAEKDAARLNAIRARIATITGLLDTAAMARNAASLQRLVDSCAAVVIDESFAELAGEATAEKARVLGQLQQRHADKAELETLRAAAPAPTPAPTEAPAPAPTEAPTHPNGAPMFSTTVFKDNGDPIMLDADGKRSIFCDVDEGEAPLKRGTYAPLRDEPAATGSLDEALGSLKVVGTLHSVGGPGSGRFTGSGPIFDTPARIVTETAEGSGVAAPVAGQVDAAVLFHPERAARPSDAEMLDVLAEHYDETRETVAGWLKTFDAAAALAQQSLIA